MVTCGKLQQRKEKAMERRISWWLVGVFLVASLWVSEAVAAKDGMYEVVSPLGKSTAKVVPISPRLANLENKRIGFVWVGFANGDVLVDALTDLLGKRIKGIGFIKLPGGKTDPWGKEPLDGTTGKVAKEAGVDAVIVAVGG
jgi:hypothetical protein